MSFGRNNNPVGVVDLSLSIVLVGCEFAVTESSVASDKPEKFWILKLASISTFSILTSCISGRSSIERSSTKRLSSCRTSSRNPSSDSSSNLSSTTTTFADLFSSIGVWTIGSIKRLCWIIVSESSSGSPSVSGLASLSNFACSFNFSPEYNCLSVSNALRFEACDALLV